jgi:hypothetical protein
MGDVCVCKSLHQSLASDGHVKKHRTRPIPGRSSISVHDRYNYLVKSTVKVGLRVQVL